MQWTREDNNVTPLWHWRMPWELLRPLSALAPLDPKRWVVRMLNVVDESVETGCVAWPPESDWSKQKLPPNILIHTENEELLDASSDNFSHDIERLMSRLGAELPLEDEGFHSDSFASCERLFLWTRYATTALRLTDHLVLYNVWPRWFTLVASTSWTCVCLPHPESAGTRELLEGVWMDLQLKESFCQRLDVISHIETPENLSGFQSLLDTSGQRPNTNEPHPFRMEPPLQSLQITIDLVQAKLTPETLLRLLRSVWPAVRGLPGTHYLLSDEEPDGCSLGLSIRCTNGSGFVHFLHRVDNGRSVCVHHLHLLDAHAEVSTLRDWLTENNWQRDEDRNW